MKRAVIVVGLGFGDEGKGSVVDAVCREIGATMVVRYNGGPQAAHRVVLPDGRSHVFAQFGSGTFAAAGTFISRFMSFEPIAFLNEAEALERIGHMRPFDTVWIDGDAPMITPYHRALNRLREWARGDQRHGSCGMGVGELAADLIDIHASEVIRAKDLRYSRDVLREKLRIAYERKRQIALRLPLPKNVLDVDTELDVFRTRDAFARAREDRWIAKFEQFAEHVTILRDPVRWNGHENIVFEGAQGILLDETFGFHPHTTWSNCTTDNAWALLEEGGATHHVTTLGVTRTYATRHGAGPFPTEARGLVVQEPDPHNTTGAYQGEFRVGYLDTVLLRYAMGACSLRGIDGLAVTHVDTLERLAHVAMATHYDSHLGRRWKDFGDITTVRPHYRQFLGDQRVERFLETLAREAAETPIMVQSNGPTFRSKTWLPAWTHRLAAAYTA